MINNKRGIILGIILVSISTMGNILLTVYFPEKAYLSMIGYLLIGLGTAIAIFSATKDSDHNAGNKKK